MVPDPSKIYYYNTDEILRILTEDLKKAGDKMISKILECVLKSTNEPKIDVHTRWESKSFERILKSINKIKADVFTRSENKSLNEDNRKYSLVAKAQRQEMHSIHTSKSYNKQNHCKGNYLKRIHFH